MTELNEVRRGVYGEVGAEFGEPLPEEEVAALPEGARVVVIWSGGNGPHTYVITVGPFGGRHVVSERDDPRGSMRYYNPLVFVGGERFHTRVWPHVIEGGGTGNG